MVGMHDFAPDQRPEANFWRTRVWHGHTETTTANKQPATTAEERIGVWNVLEHLACHHQLITGSLALRNRRTHVRQHEPLAGKRPAEQVKSPSIDVEPGHRRDLHEPLMEKCLRRQSLLHVWAGGATYVSDLPRRCICAQPFEPITALGHQRQPQPRIGVHRLRASRVRKPAPRRAPLSPAGYDCPRRRQWRKDVRAFVSNAAHRVDERTSTHLVGGRATGATRGCSDA